MRDLSIYTLKRKGKLSYYYDDYGLEIDCVLHLNDGSYALIEFKLGSKQIDEGASHLLEINRLIEKKNDKIRKPKFLAIITGGNVAYTRKDGVKVIPIGCLR